MSKTISVNDELCKSFVLTNHKEIKEKNKIWDAKMDFKNNSKLIIKKFFFL